MKRCLDVGGVGWRGWRKGEGGGGGGEGVLATGLKVVCCTKHIYVCIIIGTHLYYTRQKIVGGITHQTSKGGVTRQGVVLTDLQLLLDCQ